MVLDIAALKSQRTSLAGRLAGIMEGAERLRFAEREEARLLAEIGRLGEAEVARMKEWAASGAHGEVPKIDVAERTRLAGELAQAQLQAEAARAAGLDLGEEQRRVTGKLQSVNAAIDNAAFDALAARHAAEVANLAAFVRENVAPKIARAMGLHAFLAEMGQRHIASGRTELGTDILRRAEVIGRALPSLDAEPTPGEVISKIGLWASRFAELTADAPASNVVALGTGATA